MSRTLWLFASCLLFLLTAGAEGKRSSERVYYVGIIEDSWDYAPSGKNLLNGQDVEKDEWVLIKKWCTDWVYISSHMIYHISNSHMGCWDYQLMLIVINAMANFKLKTVRSSPQYVTMSRPVRVVLLIFGSLADAQERWQYLVSNSEWVSAFMRLVAS